MPTRSDESTRPRHPGQDRLDEAELAALGAKDPKAVAEQNFLHARLGRHLGAVAAVPDTRRASDGEFKERLLDALRQSDGAAGQSANAFVRRMQWREQAGRLRDSVLHGNGRLVAVAALAMIGVSPILFRDRLGMEDRSGPPAEGERAAQMVAPESAESLARPPGKTGSVLPPGRTTAPQAPRPRAAPAKSAVPSPEAQGPALRSRSMPNMPLEQQDAQPAPLPEKLKADVQRQEGRAGEGGAAGASVEEQALLGRVRAAATPAQKKAALEALRSFYQRKGMSAKASQTERQLDQLK